MAKPDHGRNAAVPIEHLVAGLNARLRAAADGRASAVLGIDALNATTALIARLAASPPTADTPRWLTAVAMVHMARAALSDEPDPDDEQATAGLLVRGEDHFQDKVTAEMREFPYDQLWSQQGRSLLSSAIKEPGATLDAAIRLLGRSVVVAEPNNPALPERLSNLGTALLVRGERGDEPGDVDLAIQVLERSVRVAPSDSPHRYSYHAKLGNAWRARYGVDRDLAGLRAAIAAYHEAVQAMPLTRPWPADIVHNFAVVLGDLCAATPPDADLLDEGIRLADAAALEPLHHLVATLRSRRFEATQSDHDPDAAIAVGADPAWLGSSFAMRYQRSGDPSDLDKSVEYLRRGSEPGALCVSLDNRYRLTGDLSDRDELITAAEQALAMPDATIETRIAVLWRRGSALADRYWQDGADDDLAPAIDDLRLALSLDVPDPGVVALLERKLGELNRMLYQREHRLSAAEAGLRVGWAVLQDEAIDDQERMAAALNLGILYELRYEHVGHQADLDRAIELYRMSLGGRWRQADRAECLTSLGGALRVKAQRDNDALAAIEAVACLRKALGESRSVRQLGNLAGALLVLRAFQLRPDSELLDEAVSLQREAVTRSRGVQRATALSNLINILAIRSDEDDRLDDSHEAIALYDELLALLPSGHPLITVSALTHAELLARRYDASQHTTDATRAVGILQRVALDRTAAPKLRVAAARLWARLADHHYGPLAALDAFTAGLDAQTAMAWRGLARIDMERHLTSANGLANDAAACAIAAGLPAHAVVVAERGRSVLWSELLNQQYDFARLRHVDPVLAEELARIQSDLEAIERTLSAQGEESIDA
ncbi:MAG: hypothetical protein ACRDSE_00100 [Pseudonocardiaceae bacterium]